MSLGCIELGFVAAQIGSSFLSAVHIGSTVVQIGSTDQQSITQGSQEQCTVYYRAVGSAKQHKVQHTVPVFCGWAAEGGA